MIEKTDLTSIPGFKCAPKELENPIGIRRFFAALLNPAQMRAEMALLVQIRDSPAPKICAQPQADMCCTDAWLIAIHRYKLR